MNDLAQATTRKNVSNKDLLHYLKTVSFESSFFDRLKVYYRPIICPFVELIGLVNEGEKVGDIGCGSGQFCLLLAKFSRPSYIFGIEISDKLIDNAKQLFKQHAEVPYHFEKFDGVHFPEQIKELDVLFLNDVLHHVPKNAQEKFVKDLVGKMKTGARLIIKDINGSSPLVYCNKVHDLLFAGEIGNELPFEKTRTWMEQNNLQIVDATKKRMYVYPHYTIVAKKQ
jgi:2-polyprenyl-3-methyl-5-hydroxy-6-metoxy-1,4-benzoquinol methylase